MGSQTENLLTVIDIGSAKTCVIVAEVNDYALRYRGHGIADSRGLRKGVIADLDKAVASIKKAVEEAENAAQAPVEHAVVGVAGSHIRGINSHGGVSLGSRSRGTAPAATSRPSWPRSCAGILACTSATRCWPTRSPPAT